MLPAFVSYRSLLFSVTQEGKCSFIANTMETLEFNCRFLLGKEINHADY